MSPARAHVGVKVSENPMMTGDEHTSVAVALPVTLGELDPTPHWIVVLAGSDS